MKFTFPSEELAKLYCEKIKRDMDLKSEISGKEVTIKGLKEEHLFDISWAQSLAIDFDGSWK